MPKICLIGHITKDRVLTPQSEKIQPGGSTYYCCHALRHFDVKIHMVTSLGRQELLVLNEFDAPNIEISHIEGPDSLFFENIYGENQDDRIQRVLSIAPSIDPSNSPQIDSDLIHFGPLLRGDVSLELISDLSSTAKISLDVQGLIRYTNNQKIIHEDLKNAESIFSKINIVKTNAMELGFISNQKNIRDAAKELSDWGIDEVVITLGSEGSLIYYQNQFTSVAAYQPTQVLDATGCGDTYMAGYLFQRLIGSDIDHAGRYGAAMASLKISKFGPFDDSVENIESMIESKNSI